MGTGETVRQNLYPDYLQRTDQYVRLFIVHVWLFGMGRSLFETNPCTLFVLYTEIGLILGGGKRDARKGYKVIRFNETHAQRTQITRFSVCRLVTIPRHLLFPPLLRSVTNSFL